MTEATPDRVSTEGPLSEHVRDVLRQRIIERDLAPGARLVERQLAAELDVSRVPVREALRALRAEGFVEDRPPRGMVVRQLTSRDVDDLFDVREALEAVLCRRVAERLDEAGREALLAVLIQARDALKAGDHHAAVRANAAFHDVLLEVSNSSLLASMLAPLGGRMRWLLQQHDDPASIHEEHERMYEALAAGDVAAATRLAREHLLTSRSAVLRQRSDG